MCCWRGHPLLRLPSLSLDQTTHVCAESRGLPVCFTAIGELLEPRRISSVSPAGPGFNAGFLGLLHADVFHQRLREEYGADVIATVPTVPYRAVAADGAVTEIRSPAELPDAGAMRGSTLEEPMVNATIMAPKEAVGALVQLCVERRGVQLEHTFIDASRALLRYKARIVAVL